MHRRTFLASALGLPAAALAATAASDRRLLVVFAPGGWDVTRVFADGFDHTGVDMEPDAERATAGGISYIDHGSRPSVRSFLEAEHSRTVVLNGLLVRSIAHDICTMLALTGTSSGLAPDWPAIVASGAADRYTLPHLVVDGPSFPGELGAAVARTGAAGQLETLVSGDVFGMVGQARINRVAEQIVDRHMARRANARALAARGAVDQALTADFESALGRLGGLKDLSYTMDFTGGATLSDQAAVAVEALAQGVCRAVTIASPGTATGGTWDTHADNDNLQAPLWESLFQGLGLLMSALDTTTGPSGAPLSSDTLVLVLSEMGRTPALNGVLGKDHWPYTSAMLIGPGLTGSRAIGGFDAGWAGQPVDPASGEVVEDGPLLSAEALGATALAWAGVDPAGWVDGVEPLAGVLI
jgi:hypothetical protein